MASDLSSSNTAPDSVIRAASSAFNARLNLGSDNTCLTSS